MGIAGNLTAALAQLAVDGRWQVLHFAEFLVAKRGKAMVAGCDMLYSEDIQDGQVFEGQLTVTNPFAAS
jgi:predicted nucleic acid-binding protein